jgi:CBS domain-containing protein
MTGEWVVWVVVGAALLLVIAAYLAGRNQARHNLREQGLKVTLATRVEEVMSRPVVVVAEDTTFSQAAERMVSGGLGALPVVDDQGKLTGVVTGSDLTGTSPRLSHLVDLRTEGADAAYAAAASKRVTEVMNRRVVTTAPDEPVSDAAVKMIEARVHHLPVVSGGIPVGMLSRQDLLALVARVAAES